MALTSQLKILCLHGFTQNGSIMRERLVPFKDKISGIAEFVYINGPHEVQTPEYSSVEERENTMPALVSEESKSCAWWYPPRYKETRDGYCQGFFESLELIKKVLLERGPFDGVLGFSQGAALAAIMTQLLEHRNVMPDLLAPDFAHPAFRFSIMAGGFKAKYQPAIEPLYALPMQTPSMHMIGKFDTIVAPEDMQILTERFEKPVVFQFDGGHIIPSRSTQCQAALVKFLKPFTDDSKL